MDVAMNETKTRMNTKANRETYIQFFDNEEVADAFMRMRNRARVSADVVVVVDGPEDNWAVVDLSTAIELGGGYRWAV
jgi:hypothetical protein